MARGNPTLVALVAAAILAAGCTGLVGTQGLDAQRPPPCEDSSPDPPGLLVDEREALSMYRWDASEGSYERAAQADGVSDPLWAHDRIYALAEDRLLILNGTLAETDHEPVRRPETVEATDDGLLLAANGSLVSLSPDVQPRDRLGPEELIGVDVRKNVHAIHAEDGTAWMLDNTVAPVWIVRATVEDLSNLSVDARHQMDTLSGHLPFHWLQPDEGTWNVVETSSSSEPVWMRQTVHRFDHADVGPLDSTRTWLSEEGSDEEGLRIEAISPDTSPWALVQRRGDVGSGTIRLDGGDLVASNLSLLASGDPDERYESGLAVDADHVVASVNDEVILLDSRRNCLLDRTRLSSRGLGVELMPGRAVPSG